MCFDCCHIGKTLSYVISFGLLWPNYTYVLRRMVGVQHGVHGTEPTLADIPKVWTHILGPGSIVVSSLESLIRVDEERGKTEERVTFRTL